MKNKWFRIITLVLTIAMLAAMSACSVTGHVSTTTTTTQTNETSAPATPIPAVQTTAPVGSDNAATVYKIETKDGLVTIEFENSKWSEVKSEENTEMFSNGDCSILVNLYKSTDTVPASAKKDETHPLSYTATVRSGNYQIYVVGYATTVNELTEIAEAVSTIRMNPDKVTDAMLNHTAATTATTQTSTTSQPAAITQTGAAVTLYTGSGSAVTLHGYTDGSWRTSDGTAYSAINSNTWMNNSGTCLYTTKPSTQQTQITTQHNTQATVYRTGVSFPLYYSNGCSVTVYEYSDNTYRDDYGYYYHKYNAGQWERSDGVLFGLEYDPAPEEAMPTGVSFPVYDSCGAVTYVYEMTDGTYEDDYGMTYHKYNAGMWERCDGALFSLEYDYAPAYDDTPVYGADPVYDTSVGYSADPVEVTRTGVSFPLYRQDGTYVTVYEYSDGSYQDCYGMTYHKYNAGQWQSATGELFSLEPVYSSTYQDVYTGYEDEDCYCM